ncbi:MAG: hypothetical protein IJN50_07750 [Clostridia bacterium]|nr:hypothetical protein [Clostridiales bacterium]MBQ6992769.1 hypothetical protein [Clostridia bacterium]
MTLWELMESLSVRILCPQAIGELTIDSMHKVCRMKIRNYFISESERFQGDLETCAFDYDTVTSLGHTPVLFFDINKEDSSITLKLSSVEERKK